MNHSKMISVTNEHKVLNLLSRVAALTLDREQSAINRTMGLVGGQSEGLSASQKTMLAVHKGIISAVENAQTIIRQHWLSLLDYQG